MAAKTKKQVRVSTPSNPVIEDDSSGDEPLTQTPDIDNNLSDPLSFEASQSPRVSFKLRIVLNCLTSSFL